MLDERPYLCDLCPHRAKRKDQLRFHMETHTDQMFECKICFKTVLNSKMLSHHIRNMHSEKKHDCTLCTASYNSYKSLKRHIEKHHAKVKNGIKYTCDICDEKFYLKSYLEIHISRNHSQPYKCLHEGCTRSFSILLTRRNHHFSMHRENFKVSHVHNDDANFLNLYLNLIFINFSNFSLPSGAETLRKRAI